MLIRRSNMKKVYSIILLLLLSLLLLILVGCNPKTGEAKIKLPKELGTPKDDTYYLSEDWYGKTLNFRDFVKVNDDTTWVLSKKKTGEDPIKSFTITLGESNTVYVVCSDRIGISKTYKFSFVVEGYIHNYFFLDYDYEAIYDYAYEHYGNNSSGSHVGVSYPTTITIGEYIFNVTWSQIEKKQVVGNSVFYCDTECGSFNTSIKYPENNPTKAGYTFKRWKRVCESKRLNGEPQGESKYQLNPKKSNRTTSYAYVAVWETP